TNGTKVNGQRVRWAALLPNDRVTVGGYKMRVYLGADDVRSPSEGGKMQLAPAAATRAPAKENAAPARPGKAGKPARPVKSAKSPARNGAQRVPPEPAVGFASPSPLGTPTVSGKGVKDPNWVSPDLLMEDDDDLPAPRKAASQAFPSDDEDQVFIIDLD
ncbi:MAG TPA: FHA domain-containing protein, partial [Isosphaeraceae bacterium]|nr:FHA domain-containing protein [Isosphaeraceae bacterium]